MDRPRPTTDPPTASLIFPSSTTHNLAGTLSALRKSTLSIHNRLRSIRSDAEFVLRVSSAFGTSRPVFANERCGSWYIPPARKGGSCYFKSTDGHTGQWGFSLRRLNSALLEAVSGRALPASSPDHIPSLDVVPAPAAVPPCDAAPLTEALSSPPLLGCIVVDSTRRGKSMPDALAKTIPIWCAVWNRIWSRGMSVDDEKGRRAGRLHTPPNAVSQSEHSQIDERLDGFVKGYLDLGIEPPPRPLKPLRPIWITQESSLPSTPPVFDDFIPVICCTASRRVVGAEASENGYIQGAGDDSEGWAMGLTPSRFWEHSEELWALSEPDLRIRIAQMVDESKRPSIPRLHAPFSFRPPTVISPTKSFCVMPLPLHWSPTDSLPSEILSSYAVVITSSPSPSFPLSCATIPPAPTVSASTKAQTNPHLHIHIPLPSGPSKQGSRALRPLLRAALALLYSPSITKAERRIDGGDDDDDDDDDEEDDEEDKHEEEDGEIPILIASTSPFDHGTGIALAVLCLLYDSSGSQERSFLESSSTTTTTPKRTKMTLDTNTSTARSTSTSAAGRERKRASSMGIQEDENENEEERKEGGGRKNIDKAEIRRKLAWLLSSFSPSPLSSAFSSIDSAKARRDTAGGPSRATIQAVHDVLMSPSPSRSHLQS